MITFSYSARASTIGQYDERNHTYLHAHTLTQLLVLTRILINAEATKYDTTVDLGREETRCVAVASAERDLGRRPQQRWMTSQRQFITEARDYDIIRHSRHTITLELWKTVKGMRRIEIRKSGSVYCELTRLVVL